MNSFELVRIKCDYLENTQINSNRKSILNWIESIELTAITWNIFESTPMQFINPMDSTGSSQSESILTESNRFKSIQVMSNRSNAEPSWLAWNRVRLSRVEVEMESSQVKSSPAQSCQVELSGFESIWFHCWTHCGERLQGSSGKVLWQCSASMVYGFGPREKGLAFLEWVCSWLQECWLEWAHEDSLWNTWQWEKRNAVTYGPPGHWEHEAGDVNDVDAHIKIKFKVNVKAKINVVVKVNGKVIVKSTSATTSKSKSESKSESKSSFKSKSRSTSKST